MAGMSKGIFDKKLDDILLSFLFLKEQKKISVKRSKEDLEKAKKEIISTVKEIEKSGFLPNPGMMCDFCDYKLLCPAWQ
jgi:DNA helicase-2/ATP-dependent DNA helicase PcrA